MLFQDKLTTESAEGNAMGLPQRKLACYEDLFDLPESVVGEIIDGRLNVQPRPAPKHARAYSSLGFELGLKRRETVWPLVNRAIPSRY